MATVKGQTFYDIAPQPAPLRSDPWETETGKELDGEGGRYSIPGFSRSVQGSFCSPGYVDLNIYIKTGCFWQHGTVQEMTEAWQNQYPSSTPDRLNQLQEFLRRAPLRLSFQEQGLDRFSGIKGLGCTDRPPRGDFCEMRHINRQHFGGHVRDYFSIKHNWKMDPNVYVVKIGKESPKGYLTVPTNLRQVVPGRLKSGVIPQFSTRWPDETCWMIVEGGHRTFCSKNAAEDGAAADCLTLEPIVKVPVTFLARPNLRYKLRGNSNQTKYVARESIKAGQWNVQGAAFVKTGPLSFLFPFFFF
ncbi:uncharacterized protein A1O5_10268 [Cladophialophora psammophila CBS 110553]|uniref:Uncharacterized protein n=1 Tax=Cladophialophora psammophila CBS 110553 TaxID=1182543 RepID=W9WEQ1_9EURO|nr:uncharacterized protein A1O5_10268 [Cladophialophora psammophila CBS 110553]EXJ66597.1 hypothetical protein A1O5_10268 [Cladophialophora psammophila CBS 110553]